MLFSLYNSGGMPRSSYGDRHTVTAMAGEEDHVVFDFSSRVVDFFPVSDPEDGHPTALIVLAEEEIVAIDLHVEGGLNISSSIGVSHAAEFLFRLTQIYRRKEDTLDFVPRATFIY